jgi:hypothetical protein
VEFGLPQGARKPERLCRSIRFRTKERPAHRPPHVRLEALMAYERYDAERRRREDERRDWDRERADRRYGREDLERDRDQDRGDRDRGFFERMGDEVRSWFGDERDERAERDRDYRRDRDEDYVRPATLASSARDYNPDYRDELARGERRHERSAWDDRDRDERSLRERDPYRSTTLAGSRARSNEDLHYHEWRRRQMEDLDRDYEDYSRDRASRFESEFGSWRERRQSKRALLRDMREHMEVVGSDRQHVGTVDRVAGDRIILTRSDPQAGGVHHSLSCTDVDRVEDDRVFLEMTADKARERWRDESRERALFEREDQGRAGPGVLDRSFSGTYR